MFRFSMPLWRHAGPAGWYFVTLPHEIADEIEERSAPSASSFGSVRVQATIGATTWNTSLFPDRSEASYLLPVKRSVRLSEHLEDGDLVTVALEIERLGSAGPEVLVPTLHVEVVEPDDERAVAALTAYFEELDRRFPTGFDPGDALDAGLGAFRPPEGAFVVVSADGAVAACGAVQRFDAHTAEIKRMWVHPDRRGRGLGRRLLASLEDRCRALGYERVVLDTNAELVEAIRMYATAGYQPTDRYNDNPYAHRWFAKELGTS